MAARQFAPDQPQRIFARVLQRESLHFCLGAAFLSGIISSLRRRFPALPIQSRTLCPSDAQVVLVDMLVSLLASAGKLH
jgi:hypothetical protein